MRRRRAGMPSPAAVVIFILATIFTVPAAAGEQAPPPLAQTLRLDLWGATLVDAVREIERQTGVAVRFHLADFPGLGDRPNLFLVTGRVPLRTVMEALAERYRFRYRVARSGRVEVSRGYGWAGQAPTLRSFHAPPAVSRAGAAALRPFLDELVKPLALFEGECFVKVDRHPSPDDPERLRITAALPPVFAVYLERAVRCLGGEAGDLPGATNPDTLYAVTDRPDRTWSDWLHFPLQAPAPGPLRSTLAAAADQAGVAIVAQPGPEAAEISVATVAGETLAALAARLAAEGMVGLPLYLSWGGIVFESVAKDGAAERDERGREFFWDGMAVAGFDASRAVRTVGDGKTLERLLRAEVFPHLWRDPACSIVYFPATGRLAVIAPPNAVAAVAERLARIG